ncbi:hypothetical protein ACJX0J_022013, partial [Zea mays]
YQGWMFCFFYVHEKLWVDHVSKINASGYGQVNGATFAQAQVEYFTWIMLYMKTSKFTIYNFLYKIELNLKNVPCIDTTAVAVAA